MISAGVIEVDLHDPADPCFHGGTGIKSAIMDEFSYGRCDKVKRVRPGSNPGITELDKSKYIISKIFFGGHVICRYEGRYVSSV